MENFKIYQDVNIQKSNLNFGISRMEDIYVKRNGEMDEPHRHNYYTVLVIVEAKGFHKIDFTTYELKNHQIFFVAPGQIHQVIESKKSVGFSLVFSEEFLIENSIPISFIENLHLFNNYGFSPPLEPKEKQFNKIIDLMEQIYTLNISDSKMKYLSIGSYLKLLLIECNNICDIHPMDAENDSRSNSIVKSFREEVDKHYKVEHSTKFYADQLFITPDHLNRVIKSKIGKSAKEYIQTRIITEAKRLLYFTDLTSREIGYELGFSEPANFSAFFKNMEGYPPSKFKKIELK